MILQTTAKQTNTVRFEVNKEVLLKITVCCVMLLSVLCAVSDISKDRNAGNCGLFHPEDERPTVLQNVWHCAPNDSNTTLHNSGIFKKQATCPVIMLHICTKQRKHLSVCIKDTNKER
jgi:hypothetical protein